MDTASAAQGTLPSALPDDARSVCNLILDEADKQGRQLTNLALQKLLYFAHGFHLAATGRPLVYGFFEAWRSGPVHAPAHEAFHRAGTRPIDFRATGEDLRTGARLPLSNPTDSDVVASVRRVLMVFGGISPDELVAISQAPGTPWRAVVDKTRTSVVVGMRIPDTLIEDRFSSRRVLVGAGPALSSGEPIEDAPFA